MKGRRERRARAACRRSIRPFATPTPSARRAICSGGSESRPDVVKPTCAGGPFAGASMLPALPGQPADPA
jgi:hypothetical protein